VSFYFISTTSMQHTTATGFTFLALLAAAALTVTVHRPWLSRGRLTEVHTLHLLAVAFLLAFSVTLAVYTIRVVEPSRGALLEHLDVALVPAVGYLVGRHKKATVARSALLAIGAVLLVVWYDPLAAAEGAAAGAGGRAMKVLPGQAVAPDAFGGIVPLTTTTAAGGGDMLQDAAATSPGVLTAAAREWDPIEESDKAERATAEGGAGAGAAAAAADPSAPPPVAPPAFPDPPPVENAAAAPPPPMPAPPASGRGRRLAEQLSEDSAPASATASSPPFAAPRIPSPSPPPASARYGSGAARTVIAQAGKVRSVIEKHERSSVLLAAALLGLAAWCNTVRRRLEKQLVAETGMGSKSVHATVLAVATLLWLPVALVRWMFLSSSTAPGSEGAAVVDAVLALGGNTAAAAAQEAVRLHAGPNIIVYLFTAALYGVVVLVLAEYAVDLPLTGNKAAVVAVLAGSGGAGGGGSAVSALPSAGGGAARLPGSAAAAAAAAAAGGQPSPDFALLRVLAMVATFLASAVLGRFCGWGYQSTWTLWAGALLYIPGIAGAAGIDASQLIRVHNVLTRGSSSGGPVGVGIGGGPGGPAGGAGAGEGGDLGSVLVAMLGALLSAITGAASQTMSLEGGPRGGGGGGGGGGAALSPLRKVLRHIWEDNNSRKIFIFLTINVSQMA
jgi:hypothetical protein